jgi:hypothetical protein
MRHGIFTIYCKKSPFDKISPVSNVGKINQRSQINSFKLAKDKSNFRKRVKAHSKPKSYIDRADNKYFKISFQHFIVRLSFFSQ